MIAVGTVAWDAARERVGVVMACEGPYVQLRPLGGGLEWDARPESVREATQGEVLSARVAEANTRGRRHGRSDHGPRPSAEGTSPPNTNQQFHATNEAPSATNSTNVDAFHQGA